MTPSPPRATISTSSPTHEEIRQGRYAVVGLLGSGSQGETLEAVDKREGRPVAIKRFTIRGAKSWKDVELAEREATVLASLSHPGLPRYIEHFEENGALYLVMEKVEGESLASRRKRGAPLGQEQVLRFLSETGACLKYLHGHAPPIVHRDIKPGNVILRPDGSYCLVDFGSVRDRLKPEGGSTVVGTFGFMAPEQFQGRAAPGSDVYAAGATALSLLTGREPEDLPHQGLAIDVNAAIGGHVDRRLVAVLRAMLEPDPDRRASSIEHALLQCGLASSTRLGSSDSPAQAAKQARRARLNESRDARKTSKQQRKAERRARRHAHADWHRPGRPVLPGVVLGLFILVAFQVAKVATFALFQVLLPTLFALLTVFGGRRMLQRGQRMIEIGRAGRRGLDRAGRHIRHQFLGAPAPLDLAHSAAPGSGPGSADPVERIRVAAETEAEAEAKAARRDAEVEAQAALRRAEVEASIEAQIEAQLEAAAEALEARLEGRQRRQRR